MKKLTTLLMTTLIALSSFSTFAKTTVDSVYNIPFGKEIEISKYDLEKKDGKYYAKDISEQFIKEVEFTVSSDNIVTQAVVRFIDTSHSKAKIQYKKVMTGMFEKYDGDIKNNVNNDASNILTDNADITILRGYSDKTSNVGILYRLHDIDAFVQEKL